MNLGSASCARVGARNPGTFQTFLGSNVANFENLVYHSHRRCASLDFLGVAVLSHLSRSPHTFRAESKPISSGLRDVTDLVTRGKDSLFAASICHPGFTGRRKPPNEAASARPTYRPGWFSSSIVSPPGLFFEFQ